MPLKVKEVFYTIQGEGHNTGRPAVFVRFAGCNLWSGQEKDRPSAICQFCDTDFVGGASYPDPARLAMAAAGKWPTGRKGRFAVLTGGEPTLQPALQAVVIELKALQFQVAVETNGTRHAPEGAWVTVSPKADTEVVQRAGDELKVVWPQLLSLDELREWDFKHFYLQPMDGPRREENTSLVVKECLADPRWRLSLQTHKYLGIP